MSLDRLQSPHCRQEAFEICIQISDTCVPVVRRSGAGRWQRKTWRTACHAAVSSQLRIPSLTPSHAKSPYVFNNLQDRVIFTLELSLDVASLLLMRDGNFE